MNMKILVACCFVGFALAIPSNSSKNASLSDGKLDKSDSNAQLKLPQSIFLVNLLIIIQFNFKATTKLVACSIIRWLKNLMDHLKQSIWMNSDQAIFFKFVCNVSAFGTAFLRIRWVLVSIDFIDVNAGRQCNIFAQRVLYSHRNCATVLILKKIFNAALRCHWVSMSYQFDLI